MSEKLSNLSNRLQIALDLRDKKAADLVRDLKIPKSAVSQYLSGKSQKMDSTRLYAICKYLDVSEPWLLGYNVPVQTGPADLAQLQKNNDALTGIVVELRTNKDFLSIVESIYGLDAEKRAGVKQMLDALLK